MADQAEHWIPNYWGTSERHFERVRDRWCGPATCCIRAGLDCACSPSAGVMGFTAGDLRRMYPEGVPDWVKGDEPWETVSITGVVPGSFDSLPDDAEIWI